MQQYITVLVIRPILCRFHYFYCVDVKSYQFSGETIHAPEKAATGLKRMWCVKESLVWKKPGYFFGILGQSKQHLKNGLECCSNGSVDLLWHNEKVLALLESAKKWAISKTFFVLDPFFMKLGEVVVLMWHVLMGTTTSQNFIKNGSKTKKFYL